MERKEFDIRSEEIQDILSFVPSWMIRWGSALFAVIFMMLLLFTWFIKYPDTITGEFKLSSSNPPIQIVNRLDGKIKAIHLQEGAYVRQGDKVIDIENVLSSDDVLFLTQFIKRIKLNLLDENCKFQILDTKNSLGDIQKDYNELHNNIKAYSEIYNNPFYKQEEKSMSNKIGQSKLLILSTERKVAISKSSIDIAQEKFQINEQLFESNVLSKMEILDLKDAYNNQKKAHEDISALLIERKMTLDDLQAQYQKLNFDRKEQKRILREKIENGIRGIENYIEIWSEGNVLKAPVGGTLSFSIPLHTNMYVAATTPLFAVIPQGEDFKAYVSVKQKGIGKIKVGNKVYLRFHNYPYKEYCQVEGVVDYIPSIAFNNSYNISIKLTDGLSTTYNQKIISAPEMQGEAEIITKDIRLAERFVYHIYSLIDD